MLYRYVKKIPKKKTRSGKLALLFVALGLFFLGNAVYPIVSYQLLVAPRFARSFVSPVTEAENALSFGLAPKVLGQEIDLVDFTRPENWFPEDRTVFTQKGESVYTLSIPKLGIEGAEVVLGGEDLKRSLIQYPGTAVPGRFGNTVVFGHSVLPQFFNPENYLTIFSTLPTLETRDKIVIEHDNVKYTYRIERMIEVSPDDISILAQRYDDSYLTLITCVPPGTYLKRLIVRARLDRE